MKFNSLIPELYVLNFQKSVDFYIQVLGFKIEYTRDTPQFAFLSYHKSQIMIQQEDENEDWHNAKPEYPFGRGINFQIETNNAQQLIDSLKKINYPLKRGLQDSYYKVENYSYGYSEFLVMDPDGYLLRFSQPHKRPGQL
jgi:catechol 2,3-dioxygenase-like lactoylglutathione lyase family enzyme